MSHKAAELHGNCFTGMSGKRHVDIELPLYAAYFESQSRFRTWDPTIYQRVILKLRPQPIVVQTRPAERLQIRMDKTHKVLAAAIVAFYQHQLSQKEEGC